MASSSSTTSLVDPRPRPRPRPRPKAKSLKSPRRALGGVRVRVSLRVSDTARASELVGSLARCLDDGALVLRDVTDDSSTLRLGEVFLKASHIRSISWDRSVNVVAMVRAQQVVAHRASRRYTRSKRQDPERAEAMRAFVERQRALLLLQSQSQPQSNSNSNTNSNAKGNGF